MLKFTKMNGAGNDFVLLDNRDRTVTLAPEQIEQLCDRHRGVGADGLLMVEPAQDGADFRMRYYNRDGGEAEMCGNGARCFARFARRFVDKDELSFETLAGVIRARIHGELVTLQMSSPHNLKLNEQIEAAGGVVTVHSVNTGVPHAIIFVDDLDHAPVHQLGAEIRYHAHFAPRGTNVNFVAEAGPQELNIRTYERGVEGETLACGTGVVASAIIYNAVRGASSPVSLRVRGGDTLSVGFSEVNGVYNDVTLTGPADFVFEGETAL